MRYNIAAVEPVNCGFGHFLDDSCRYLCYGLESLGHDCTIGFNQIESGCMNIIVGGHNLSSPADVDAIADSGDYILIQSEILHEDRINTAQNDERYKHVYLPLMQRAHSIWEGTHRNIPALDKLGLRHQFLLGGYQPQMEEVKHKKNKDIDFLFYGSVTPHRQHMLNALDAKDHRMAVVFDVRATFRNDLIARSHLNACPRQGGGMNHFPWGRICYLLNNRSLPVVESCEDQEWLEHCFPWSDSKRWVNLCENTLQRPDRDEFAEQCFDRFRAMPFKNQLQKVLDEMG